LHQIRFDGVFHQDCHGASASDVISSDGLAAFAISDNHASQSIKKEKEDKNVNIVL
jgi:hypothetical protein